MRVLPGPATVLTQFRQGGVLFTGSTVYDCYPQGAAPATITAGTPAYTAGADTTLISAGGITSPFILSHLATCDSTASGLDIVTLNTTSQSAVRQVYRRLYYDTTSYMDTQALLLYRVPGSDAVTANSLSKVSGHVIQAYLEVCVGNPQVIPDLMRVDATSASAIAPTTAAGTAVTAAAGAWNYTASPTTITASTSTAILITSLTMTSAAAVHAQVSFMTGPNPSEVAFAVIGLPRTAGTSLAGTTYTLPFPIYVPSGVRIAGRARSSAGGTVHQMGYGYVPVPIQ